MHLLLDVSPQVHFAASFSPSAATLSQGVRDGVFTAGWVGGDPTPKTLLMSLTFLNHFWHWGGFLGKTLRGTLTCWMFFGVPAVVQEEEVGRGEVGQCCHHPGEAGIAFGAMLSWGGRVRLSCSCPVNRSLEASCCRKGPWAGDSLQPGAAPAEDRQPSLPRGDAPFSSEVGSGKCKDNL